VKVVTKMSLTSHIIGSVSSSVWLWICVTTILLIALRIKKYLIVLKNLPPGPCGIPFFGILFTLNMEFHLKLTEWANKYGKAISFMMGTTRMVVLSDYKLIKKAFAKVELSSRPQQIISDIIEGKGLINVNGKLWQTQRKFLIQQKFGMKAWGSGTNQIEQTISKEVEQLISSIENAKKNPFDPEAIINCAVSNVICSITMSTRFKEDDEKFRRFMHLFDEGFKLFNKTGPLIFIPVLKHIPCIQETVEHIKKNRAEMLEFVRYIIDDHKKTLNPKAPRDLVDTYLLAAESAREDGTYEELFAECADTDQQLEQILLDIFSAGVESTKTALQWLLLHMIHNPNIQKKVQEELNRVVGQNRLPTIEDIEHLHYTRATIYETMRRNTVTPLGVARLADRSVMLEGHLIPKNSHVLPNIHAVHMDPEIWDAPEDFKPERFLNEEGKVQKPKEFMPFSAGQRMCPGDQIAEMELVLFFSSLLHVYEIKNPENTPLPSLVGNAAVTLCPKKFEVHFIQRNFEAFIKTSQRRVRVSDPFSKHIQMFESSRLESAHYG